MVNINFERTHTPTYNTPVSDHHKFTRFNHDATSWISRQNSPISTGRSGEERSNVPISGVASDVGAVCEIHHTPSMRTLDFELIVDMIRTFELNNPWVL